MENGEILKQVELKLNEKYDIEIDNIYHLHEADEIIVFEYDANEMCGIFSTTLNKVIYEPETCSDVTFHPDFRLISLDSYDKHERVWIDLHGKEILRGGTIFQYFGDGCYYAEVESENFSGDRIESTKAIIKPGLEDEDGEDISVLVSQVHAVSETEFPDFLVIKIKNSRAEILIGVYDITKLKWICQPQIIND